MTWEVEVENKIAEDRLRALIPDHEVLLGSGLVNKSPW
jgi:hypothetical protein